MTRLEVEGVSHDYGGRPALDDVDLSIEPGEILAVIGPNGAGKSTLVSIAAGLLAPRSGTVRFEGAPVAAARREGRVGLAPQDLGIYPGLTVRQNLAYFLELARTTTVDRSRRVDEVAGALLLTPLLERRAGHLSGGEKRRLHTAIGVIAEPPLLLLDEPTVGADIDTRQQILGYVRALAERGTSICYTTHYLDELDVLDPSIAILHDGRIRLRGTRRDIVATATSPSVQLRFGGPAPAALAAVPGAVIDGSGASVPVDSLETALVDVVKLLGDHFTDVVSIDIARPGLEAAYRHIVQGAA